MRGRVLGWCVLAYPRARRDADGEMLHDLAMDLAEHHGTGREVVALLCGGMVERVRHWSVRPRAATASLLAAAAITAVALPAAAGEENVEHEQIATGHAR